MKRISVFIVLALLCGFSPRLGEAQSLWPSLLTPTISRSSVLGDLRLDVAWLTPATQMVVALDWPDGKSSTRDRGTCTGLWLGLLGEVRLRDSLELGLAGTWLLPTSILDWETVEGPLANPAVQNLWFKKWMHWYTCDASLLYSIDETFQLVAGFRYDVMEQTSQLLTRLGTAGQSNESTNVLTSWIPYVGARVFMAPLRLSIIWSQLVIGDVKGKGGQNNYDYRGAVLLYDVMSSGLAAGRTNRLGASYFLEVSMEYGRAFMGGEFNLLGKWSVLYWTGSMWHEQNTLTFNRETQTYGFEAFSDLLNMNRQVLIIGGSFSIPFSSPL